MIVLDRDVLVGLGNADPAVIDYLQAYRSAEWTLPSIVAWESYRAEPSRSEMLREQTDRRSPFDRILDFDDDAALEAAYPDEKLRSQSVSLDVADLLNVAVAQGAGGNRHDSRRQHAQSLPQDARTRRGFRIRRYT